MKQVQTVFLCFWFIASGAVPGEATMHWSPAEVAVERIQAITGQDSTEPYASPGFFTDILAQMKKSALAVPLDRNTYPPELLTAAAWEALEERDITKVEAAVFLCLEIYGEDARKLQAEFEADYNKYITALMTLRKTTMRPLVYVGEALFALGEAYRREGREEEALIVYGELVRHYSFTVSERR